MAINGTSGLSSAKSSPQDVAANGVRGTPIRVGMFHPKAGNRSAGGVAVYVQELTRHLGATNPTYLYTERGPEGATVAESAAETVTFRRDERWELVRSAAERSPVTLRRFSAQLSESLDAFVNAALDGVVGHIERNVDVLFTHSLVDTVLLSNSVDVPVVRIFHGCKQAGLGSRVLGRVSERAGAVANSSQTAREIADNWGHNVDGIVYPGIEPSRFGPDREPAFEREEPVVLYVGRFLPSKGVGDLVEAFADLSVDAHLRLVGRGDVEQLRRTIDDHGVGDSVAIEGEVPHERVPKYYAAADVTCLSSHYESFGMVNLEAMASGCPVVTTDLPGIREYAVDGENCLLVPPGNPGELADSLDRVLSSPALRKRLARAGLSVAEEYAWASSADHLLTVSRDILDRTR